MEPHHIKSLEEDPRYRETVESSQTEDASASVAPSRLVIPADLPKEVDTLVDDMKKPVFVSFSKKGRIRRNGPCPCGSGKKYKACHLQGMQRKQAYGLPALVVTSKGIDAARPLPHLGYQPPKSVRKALIKAMKESRDNERDPGRSPELPQE